MNLACVRLILTVLIAAVVASCAPTHEVSRTATAAVLRSSTDYVIQHRLYRRVNVVRDTLICAHVQPEMPHGLIGADATSATSQATKRDSSRALHLLLLPDAQFEHADTVWIPIATIERTNRRETNSTFVVGSFFAGFLVLPIVLMILLDDHSWFHIM